MSKDDHSSRIHPPVPNKPGVKNWVEKHGGLPRYIERVAKHIMADSGYPVSRAIAAAISQTKKRAAKGNAEAVAAIAQWSRMKAAAGSTKNLANTPPLNPRYRVLELAGNYSQEGGRTTGTVSYGSGPSQKQRASAQKKGQAFKSGRYPIRNVSDLKKAVRAFGRARDSDKPALKRFIMRRARALGQPQLIPSSWTSTKSGSR